MRSLRFNLTLILTLLAAALVSVAQQPTTASDTSKPVLWTDPGDIRSRNLFWGPGGEKRQPSPPFQFVEEDMHGSNPKFDVTDSDGKKWRLKMGPEAQPEVAATRLLWAVGYTANENYFLKQAHVDKLPDHLTRGQNYVEENGNISNVRLQRRPKGEKKKGDWDWRHNPFVDTRELNGLRVMMALIRNWDLNDDNNAILEDESGQQIYEVTDVGTAFGTSGRRYSNKGSKGNLDAFEKGKLIAKVTGDYVDLNFPNLPPPIFAFNPRFYTVQVHARWVGKHIPRADAKWIGSLLAQLSSDQIRDAFRAAGYSSDKVESFTTTLISRIQELNQL